MISNFFTTYALNILQTRYNKMSACILKLLLHHQAKMCYIQFFSKQSSLFRLAPNVEAEKIDLLQNDSCDLVAQLFHQFFCIMSNCFKKNWVLFAFFSLACVFFLKPGRSQFSCCWLLKYLNPDFRTTHLLC